MNPIKPNGDVCICFAVDNNYAPHLRVTLNSLIRNRSSVKSYDIIVLHSGLTEASMTLIREAEVNEPQISLRFVDISGMADDLRYDVGSYLSVATMYRLAILSELFSGYDRCIYLDCDTIVESDIGELFGIDMAGKPLAAVIDAGMRQLSFCKKAIFINGRDPYNADNYRTDALGMKHPEDYFNAGVLLFDLKKCRQLISYEKLTGILHSRKYFFNDQDVLNIAFDGQVHLIDFEWNCQNVVEVLISRRPEIYGPMYADMRRSSPRIIHFVSSYKPWSVDVAYSDIFHKYE